MGGVSSVLGTDGGSDAGDVVLQVLDVKPLGEGKKRARLSLSDGAQWTLAMAATQCFDKVTELVEAHALIRLTKYSVSENGTKKFVIVLGFDVVENGAAVGARLGAPQEFGAGGATPKKPYGASNGATTPATVQASCARGPISVNHGDVKTVPVASLNPYMNRWTLKAKVAVKNDIVSWSNARGDGTLFKVTLADADGEEIEAVFFKEACAKYHAALVEGGVYYFSGGKVKPSNPRYSATKCGYEVTFDMASKIEACADASGIGGTKYDFVKISALEQADEGQVIDVLAVVKTAEDCAEVVSQKLGGKTLTKRDVTLVDASGVDVRLTLWGERAKQDQFAAAPVVALKGVKVSEYQGTKSLGFLRSSRVAFEPEDAAGYEELKAWWANGGASAASTSLSRVSNSGSGLKGEKFADRRGLQDLKDDARFGQGDKPDYATFKATLMKVKEDRLWYESCGDGCQKKVTQGTDGTYSCEKCGTTKEECERRYIVSCCFVDASGSSWVSAFNDAGLVLFDDVSANDLAAMKDGSEADFEAFLKTTAYFGDYLVRVRAKTETWNDQSRVKTSVVNIARLDYAAESRSLLAALAA